MLENANWPMMWFGVNSHMSKSEGITSSSMFLIQAEQENI